VPVRFQVVIDCADADLLARFWAAALAYELAPVPDGFCHHGSFTEVDVNRVVRAMFSLGIDLVRWYRPDRSDTPEQLGEFNAHLALTMVTSPTYRPS
jgi:glyoxalase superfamily protein